MSDKGVLQFSSVQPRSQGAAQVASKAILVPSWQRARDQSCAALLAGEMCVVVTGLPGTGKTLLVDTAARVLRSTGWTIATVTGRLPTEAEFAALTGSAAIMIDDADRLSAVELRTLNRLRQCSVLLAGAVGLEKRCPADSRVTLAPLAQNDMATYVGLWLEQAGLSPDLVTEAAIVRLADVSAGIPRVLGILLSASLKSARVDGSEQIDEQHVDSAAWHHVEHTAARRLNRATSSSPSEARQAKPVPTLPDPELEKRLAQAPFAELPALDAPRSLLSSRVVGRVLRLAAFAVALGLAVVAGVLTSQHWPQISNWVSGLVASVKDRAASAPTHAVTATPTVPEPVAAASATPTAAQPSAPDQVSGPVEAMPPPPSVATAQPSRPIVEVAPATVAPAAAASVGEPPVPSDSLSPAVIKLLLQRGQQMIDLNDYSAARLLFTRAAGAGSVRAMLALGRSYDPNVNGNLASLGNPDPAEAAQWYRKAAELGNSDAAILLQQLERLRE